MSSDFFTQIIEFINELVKSLDSGYLFFGNGWDFARYIIDILLVTLLFYWIFLFIRQTRAWQLMKGVVAILVFVALCSLVGLDMVGFLFNKLLYVFAILFIILFQPELRRVLETVGLRTSGSVRGIFSRKTDSDEAEMTRDLIREICDACELMSKSYTGALILIERNTQLNELLEQENVVHFESTVTSSVLRSIFYKGSPMHDGAILIRNGLIIAARAHVPLSVTMHELERAGTRHRAAVGASELGDTVAVVVSEERGQTSLAVDGRLFTMTNRRELEANLSYLLGVSEEADNKGILKKLKNKKKSNEPEHTKVTQAEAEGASVVPVVLSTKEADEMSNLQRVSVGTRIFLLVISLFLSVSLWLYIQVNNNPVVTKTLTVPITYNTSDIPDGIEVSYPVESVELTIVGRQNTLKNLTTSTVTASIDYSDIDGTSSGVYDLSVVINAERNIYFRVEQQLPETVSVTVYSVN